MAPPKKGGGLNLGPAPAPPPSNKNLSTGAAYNAFINAHPTMRDYADQIYGWAKTYGVDPVVMASLYWRESFAAAKASGADPRTIVSPAGAVGIGQIMPLHVGEKTPWGHVVSQTDLTNPKFNIRWSTWYFSQQISKYGDIDSAYSKGYNPGYTGPALTSLLPKQYVPRAGLSPADKGTVTAETAAATAAAKAQVTEKWAVLDKGKVKFVPISDVNVPPKNALTYAGTPLTRTTFAQVWQQTYADTFEAYTGRQASGAEIQKILAQSPSVYKLSNDLVQQPGFSKSPVYKQHAPGLIELGRQYLGENWQPSGGIIRQAIAQNWDQATFVANVKKRPEYLQGPDFKTNLAQNQSQFEQIYGKADAGAQTLLRNVTEAGWTPAQFSTWLRQQDAYKQTSEYQAKSVSFLTQLGLITGANATLSGDQVEQMLSAQDRLKLSTASAATGTNPAPELVSEHGKGGGYTVPPTQAPQLVSEHGMGGGYR